MAVKEARTPIIRRWRKNMEMGDSPEDRAYVDMLATLSEGSVRRNFNPYTDIDWDSPEFAVIPDDDPRWILPGTDPIGRPSVVPVAAASSGRSRSGCGARPTSPRSVCTSSRS